MANRNDDRAARDAELRARIRRKIELRQAERQGIVSPSVTSKVCTQCGATIQDGAKFCGACGSKVEQIQFCTNCGAKLVSGAKFCGGCGTTTCAVVGNSRCDASKGDVLRKHIEDDRGSLENASGSSKTCAAGINIDHLAIVESFELNVGSFLTTELLERIRYEYNAEDYNDRDYEDVMNDFSDENKSNILCILADVIRDAIFNYWNIDDGDFYKLFELRVGKIKNIYINNAKDKLMSLQELVVDNGSLLDIDYMSDCNAIYIYVETEEPFDFEFNSDYNLAKFSRASEQNIIVYGVCSGKWVWQEYDSGEVEEGYFANDQNERYVIDKEHNALRCLPC